jgi:hypothetical protein
LLYFPLLMRLSAYLTRRTPSKKDCKCNTLSRLQQKNPIRNIIASDFL